MNIRETTSGGVAVLHCQGGLDATSGPIAERIIRAAAEAHAGRVVADLGQVDYLASAGLRVLQVGRNVARAAGGDLKLSSVTEPVKKVLDMTGFTSEFEFFASAEEAVAAFPPIEAKPVEVFTVEGDLDASSAPALQNELIEKVAGGKYQVVLDFSKVVYIASAGFRALQSAWMAARSQGGDVRFANLQPKVEEVFSSLGFMQMYGVYPDLPTAVMSFQDDETETKPA